jgi:hypothetical protein
MAKPTYPSVSDARRIAKQHDLLRCVVFFTGVDGRIGYASYGKTRQLCDSTRSVADALWNKYGALTAKEARAAAEQANG